MRQAALTVDGPIMAEPAHLAMLPANPQRARKKVRKRGLRTLCGRRGGRSGNEDGRARRAARFEIRVGPRHILQCIALVDRHLHRA